MKVLRIFLTVILSLAILFGAFILINQFNEKAMNEYIDSFAKVEYENQLAPTEDELGAYFVTDGDFKIMHLTDIHIGGGFLSAKNDKQAINAVAAMITAEKPDLVVITGDVSFAVPWAGTINNAYAHRMFIRLMENLGVYWTVTLGNHDSEVYDYYNRDAVASFYEDKNLKYCLFDRGPDDVYGECNHAITVRNSDGIITQSLIMIDSNSYTDEDPLGLFWIYDNIHQNQIDWYKATINRHNAHNFSLGNTDTVKSLLFMHIPLMEVRDAVNMYLSETGEVEYLGGKIGEEDPYVYSSNEAEEMFETILELDSTKGIFYGHDHLNNIVLKYKDVILSYGYSIDYFAYSDIDKIGSQRGCSIITCSSDGSFTLTHENYYQDKYQPIYEKEAVDLTN